MQEPVHENDEYEEKPVIHIVLWKSDVLEIIMGTTQNHFFFAKETVNNWLIQLLQPTSIKTIPKKRDLLLTIVTITLYYSYYWQRFTVFVKW